MMDLKNHTERLYSSLKDVRLKQQVFSKSNISWLRKSEVN